MYCKNCFRKISKTSKYCRYCGTAAAEHGNVSTANPDAGHSGKAVNSNMQGKFPVPPAVLAIVIILILLTTSIIMVTKSSVFQKTESISYKDYVGVWQERGSENIEEDGGVRLEIHGRDADTLIISMEFYGAAEENIFVDELGAVIKDGKAYYSFTNDGHGNSGNGVLSFNGRDIDWKSTVNKNEPVNYTMAKVSSAGEDEPAESTPEPSDPDELAKAPADDSDNTEYILPNSDKAYVTEDELKVLTQEELRIARNEIMARHGRIFRDPTLDAYFRSKDWYEPTMAPDEFDSQSGKLLNKYEMKNIALIKQMEE